MGQYKTSKQASKQTNKQTNNNNQTLRNFLNRFLRLGDGQEVKVDSEENEKLKT